MCSVEVARNCHWTWLSCVSDLIHKQKGKETQIHLGDFDSPWKKHTTFVSWNVDLQLAEFVSFAQTRFQKYLPRRNHSEPYPKKLVESIAQVVYDNLSVFTIFQLDKICHFASGCS